MWQGSAAICINTENKILMVLQGLPEEEKMASSVWLRRAYETA